MTKKQNIFKDISLWVLVFSNLLSMVFAVLQDWSLTQLVWVYWAQNIIIGAVNFHRMRQLEKQQGIAIKKGLARSSNFFAVHYGFFHFGYLIFLLAFAAFGMTEFHIENIPLFIFLIISFLGTHVFSYKHNRKNEFKSNKPNISVLLFYPYIRTIPMHIIIIIGFFLSNTLSLVAFIALKTMADAGMHIVEHNIFRKK